MYKFDLELNKRNLHCEIGGLAERASGCVFIQYGETSILAVTQLGEEREELDYFPLNCRFEERYYAAGRIRGSRFVKREGRPSDYSVLISRIIDRAIRPRFPKNLKQEVQILDTCLSWDEKNDLAVLGLLGTSLSLMISEIPWAGPVAALRIGRKDDQLIINPTIEEREAGKLDIFFSAVEKKDDILVNMIEVEGDEVPESIIEEAFKIAKPELKKIIEFQKEIASKLAKEKITLPEESHQEEVAAMTRDFLKDKLESVIYQQSNKERDKGLKELKKALLEKINQDCSDEELKKEKIKEGEYFFDQIFDETIKKNILEKEQRPDGRGLDDIRPIETAVSLLPVVHGSGLFSRGLTRVLSVVTLGSPDDRQILDEMALTGKKNFIHFYNFPPYSSGETGPIRGPGRREIGHGALAEKAVWPVIPDFQDFPYTILIVSEVLSSNGSTSMASVSGASLSLMDAGVPIKRPVAGIAMGIVEAEDGRYKILTDIQGPEDSHGGMDFKVAGTEKGITAVQLDVKIDGINGKILKEVLERAKKARVKILAETGKTLAQPRPELTKRAPIILKLVIDPEKIGLVVGSGGRTINEIIDSCGVDINIEDSGEVFVIAKDRESGEKAIEWVKNLTKEVAVGETYQGTVKRIMDFGAFVEILPGQEGMVHISKFVPERIDKVSDLVQVGDVIPVKVIGVDEVGKISLSAQAAGFKPKKK
jgi:polyribonucleotide nucleotidyltransferase